MKNIVVIFGGKTVEHDISIITACQLMSNIDKSKYIVTPVYITPNGKFVTGKNLTKIKEFVNFEEKKYREVNFLPASSSLCIKGKKIFVKKVDCAVIAMHGRTGEDGCLQGMLELSEIPYTSCGVLGSALSMDKAAAKIFLKGLNLPIVQFATLYKNEYQKMSDAQISKLLVKHRITPPYIVKPSGLGSSIGINLATTISDLKIALEIAFEFDDKVIIERAVSELREFNCSCLGTPTECMASVIEEPAGMDAILSYDDKYMRSNQGKTQGMASLARKIPADIDDKLKHKIQNYTIKIFRNFACSGVVRVDYLFDKESGKLFVNEINSIPGSFSYYLWEHSNIKYYELIDRIIENAIEISTKKLDKKFRYVSSVLKNLEKSGSLSINK